VLRVGFRRAVATEFPADLRRWRRMGRWYKAEPIREIVRRRRHNTGASEKMSREDGLDMDLSSGIAAFESKHFSTATRFLAPLAEQGDPEAQYRMAIMAQNGLGMVENQALALRYMQAAAEAGLGLAQHGLGFMYMQGECVEQNGQQALEWFTRAAEQGLQGAMTTIGMMYRDGTVVERDEEKARAWLRKAGFDEF